MILARIDLPQSQFDVFNAQAHRYQTFFAFGSPLLGEFSVPRGWLSVDVFVNIHMESTYPGIPDGAGRNWRR